MTQAGINRQMGGIDWGLVALLGVMWGQSFVFIKVGLLNGVSPLQMMGFRLLLGAGFLGAWLYFRQLAFPVGLRVWRDLLVLGCLNNAIPFALLATGQQFADAIVAAIIISTTPLFAQVFAHFMTHDESLSGRRVLGVGIGICGIAVMLGIGDPASRSGLGAGEGMIIAVAVLYGFSGVYGRRMARWSLAPGQIAFGQLATGALLLLPFALWWEGLDRALAIEPAGWLAILVLAVPLTGVAYILYFLILSRIGATNLFLVTLISPVSAVVVSSLWLGESVGVAQLAGMGLVAGGLLIVDGRLFRLIARAGR